MRKLKPEIRNVVASVLVASVALLGTYGISKAVEERIVPIDNELNIVINNTDSDTVKISLDNVTEIPKAVQFSIKLDDRVTLKDGEKSIKTVAKANSENDILADYTYNKKDNTIDVLLTSNSVLKTVGTRLDIMEIDVVPVDSSVKDINYKIIANNEEDFKYLNINNVEYEGFEVPEPINLAVYSESGKEPDVQPENPDAKPENPDNGNNGGGTTPENPDSGNDGGGTTPGNPDSGNNGGGTNPGNPDSGDTTPEKPELILTDVPNNHWAKYHIDKFVKAGYVNGYGDGTFRPNNKTTRAEFIKLVNRVYNFTEKGTQNFKDVKTTNWFYNDLLIAMKAGYINGYEDNTFRPNEPISREEACKILATVMGIKGDGKLNFKDNDSIANYNRWL